MDKEGRIWRCAAEERGERRGEREDELCLERERERKSRSTCSRYRLTQGKTLAQKMEGVPNMDAHDGDAPYTCAKLTNLDCATTQNQPERNGG